MLCSITVICTIVPLGVDIIFSKDILFLAKTDEIKGDALSFVENRNNGCFLPVIDVCF